MSEQSDSILRLPVVSKKIGNISRTTIYRWVKKGRFPPPVLLGGGRIGWKESTINDWIRSRPISTVAKG